MLSKINSNKNIFVEKWEQWKGVVAIYNYDVISVKGCTGGIMYVSMFFSLFLLLLEV